MADPSFSYSANLPSSLSPQSHGSTRSTADTVVQLVLLALSIGCLLLLTMVWIRMLINVSRRRRPGTHASKFQRSATLAFSTIFVSDLAHAVRFVFILLAFPEELSTPSDFRPFEWNQGTWRTALSIMDIACKLLFHGALFVYFLLAVDRWFMYRSYLHFLSDTARAITVAVGIVLYLLTFTSFVVTQIHPAPYSVTETFVVIIHRLLQQVFVLAYDATISIFLCKAAFLVLEQATPEPPRPVQRDLRKSYFNEGLSRSGEFSDVETEHTLDGDENVNPYTAVPPMPSTASAQIRSTQEFLNMGYPMPITRPATSLQVPGQTTSLGSSRITPGATVTSLSQISTAHYTPSITPSARNTPAREDSKRSVSSFTSRTTPILLLAALISVDLSVIFFNLAPRILPTILGPNSAAFEFLTATAVGVHIAISAFLIVAFKRVVGQATTQLGTQHSAHGGAMVDDDDDETNDRNENLGGVSDPSRRV